MLRVFTELVLRCFRSVPGPQSEVVALPWVRLEKPGERQEPIRVRLVRLEEMGIAHLSNAEEKSRALAVARFADRRGINQDLPPITFELSR